MRRLRPSTGVAALGGSPPDAIVVGSGPNGLVAANHLADAGWSVLVLEANDRVGGAVASAELIEPGYVNDLCSAFYPLGAGSPILRDLELEQFGLRWRRSPIVLAHPGADGRCPVLSTELGETAASLDACWPGDGAAWLALHAEWSAVREPLVDLLLGPFPPVRAAARLGLATRRDVVRFLRTMVLPVRRMAEERFQSPQARRLLAGLALHGDLAPEATMSGFYGWLLGMLGQDVGFPVPEGGAQELSDALARRLEARGGTIRTGARVEQVLVASGHVSGVRLAGGDVVRAGRAVLADVAAPVLYERLLPPDDVPTRLLDDLRRGFQWDHATFKVDWNLDGPIPWLAEPARRSGTVHVVESLDRLTALEALLVQRIVPADPFLIVGQQSMCDPTRMPAGKETAWAYTHLPREIRADERGELRLADRAAFAAAFTDRIEARIETMAPGFRSLIRGRRHLDPQGLEAHDANLVGGAIAGGTTQLHQQLVFRPTPGLGRPSTPVGGLFLASASAHPGGGVHGACGANAARAALLHHRIGRVAALGRRRVDAPRAADVVSRVCGTDRVTRSGSPPP